MNKAVRSVVAALVMSSVAFGSAVQPAKADTTSTLLITAAAAVGLMTAVNVAQKNAKAHQVVGYLPTGATVYADGHVVNQNGQSWYPGNYGQNISCNGQHCYITNGTGYAPNAAPGAYGTPAYGASAYPSGYGGYPSGYGGGYPGGGYSAYPTSGYPGAYGGSYPSGYYGGGSYPSSYYGGGYPSGYYGGGYPAGYGGGYPSGYYPQGNGGTYYPPPPPPVTTGATTGTTGATGTTGLGRTDPHPPSVHRPDPVTTDPSRGTGGGLTTTLPGRGGRHHRGGRRHGGVLRGAPVTP
jgi:hypothetical protein